MNTTYCNVLRVAAASRTSKRRGMCLICIFMYSQVVSVAGTQKQLSKQVFPYE